MKNHAIKRAGMQVGNDELVLKNGTAGAVAVGDIVAIQVDANLDTALAVTTARLMTVLAVAVSACANDATKTFRAVVFGQVKANAANGVTKGTKLVGQNASTQLAAWAADAKAVNASCAIALEDAPNGGGLTECLFDGFAFGGVNQLP